MRQTGMSCAEEASMSTRAITIALTLSLIWLAPTHRAVAQTACENRCKGSSACLKRCIDAQKRSSQTKQNGQPPPKAPAGSASSGWRERVFSSDGGGGGGY